MQTVYLLHYRKAIGNPHCNLGQAQHYLGSTNNLAARLEQHQNGTGARITEVFAERSIDFILVRTWAGSRDLERHLKSRHNNRILCPLCNPNAMSLAMKFKGKKVKTLAIAGAE